jgi:hypothetical protein
VVSNEGDFRKTLNAIDDAVSRHIKSNRTRTSIVTGWIVIASVSDIESEDRDGYIMQASERLPHHTQLGLLNMALEDKKNMSMIATIKGLMGGG